MGSRYDPQAQASQPIFDWPAAWQHELILLRSADSKIDARDASRRLLHMLGTVRHKGYIVEGKILAMLAAQCARCQLHERFLFMTFPVLLLHAPSLVLLTIVLKMSCLVMCPSCLPLMMHTI